MRTSAWLYILLLVLLGQGLPAQDSAVTDPGLEGLQEIVALREAFPSVVEDIAFRDGEWALRMRGEWFFWAAGRLLPVHLKDDWESYVSIRFYNYQTGPWRARSIDSQTEQRLRERTRNRNNDQRIRFNSFLDTLYGVSSQREADAIMATTTFLGRRVRVHPWLVAPLARVEERVRRDMMIDQDLRVFVSELGSLHGYHWRNIAGTQRRSYHAYGMAVDILPRQWDGRWGYWQWAANGGVPDWWNIPERERYHPPQGVIDAFEAEGFVWGGKWLFFDPIHFEYRPEVLILARSRFG